MTTEKKRLAKPSIASIESKERELGMGNYGNNAVAYMERLLLMEGIVTADWESVTRPQSAGCPGCGSTRVGIMVFECAQPINYICVNCEGKTNEYRV